MEKLQFNFKKKNCSQVKIFVGKGTGENISQYLRPLNTDKIFIVVDNQVRKLYEESFLKLLIENENAILIDYREGEMNKNLNTLSHVINSFFRFGGTSNSCICSFGGGITGNIAGLAASLVYRGVKLIHIPTTLLAQLDSAPDVKSSINSELVKNAIGAYKAPDLVVIDPLFLKTLNDREMRSGLAEAIKHGFSQDLNLLEIIKSVNLSDLDQMEQIIARTITLKVDHWHNTPNMWNDKHKTERLTHLGHTVGKILEMINPDYLTHGEAISHGMVMEFYMSYLMGYLSKKEVDWAKEYLYGMKLLIPLSDKYTSETVICGLCGKNWTKQPVFALLQHLGNSQTVSTVVPGETINKAIEWYFESSAV